MEFRKLLTTVGDEPLFGTGLLLAGDVDPNDVRRQLSRWTAAGKLYQLRRGLYALAPPYQKTSPHPFLVANLSWPKNTSVPGSAATRFSQQLHLTFALAGLRKTDIIQVDDGTLIKPSSHTRLLRTEYRQATPKWVARRARVHEIGLELITR